MDDSVEQLRISMDVGDARSAFLLALQTQMDVVCLLDAGLENTTADAYTRSVGSYHVNFSGLEPAGIDLARVSARASLQRHLLQDLMDATGVFVETCLNQCALIDGVNEKILSGHELQEMQAAHRKRHHSWSLPTKLDRLVELGFSGARFPDILSLNRLRNCFVHRGGVVGPQDISKGETSLRVTTLGMRFEMTGRSTGIVTYHDGFQADRDELCTVVVQWVVRSSEYPLGQLIVLSKLDISQTILTLGSFAEECTNGMRDFFKSRGILRS